MTPAEAETIIRLISMCVPLIEELGQAILPIIEKLIEQLVKLKQKK